MNTQQTTHTKNSEKFRGSIDVPLTSVGHQQALNTGIRLANKGGLDEIKTSDLGRTIDTARSISRFTHAPITYVGKGLHPWHLGPMEGIPVTPELIQQTNDMVKLTPDEAITGRGEGSTEDGESFNDFKERTLKFLQGEIHKIGSNSQRKIGLVTHFRVKKLLDAWLRKGAQSDFTIDPDVMTDNTNDHTPAGVDRLVLDYNAGPQMFGVDLNSNATLGGGLYLIRHGATAFNSEQS